MNRIIGDSIKKLRIEKNLSQHEVAKKLGYSQSMWSKIEKGKIQLRARELYSIARYFNVTMEAFFQDPKAIKDDILYNFEHYGINTFVTSSFVLGEKRKIEDLIIEILKNPKEPRYLECLPALLWKQLNTINFDQLIERCYQEKLQNRLGFIIDVTLKLENKNKKLQAVYNKIKELKIIKKDSFYFDPKFFDLLEPVRNNFVREWYLYDRFDLNSFKRHLS